MYTEFKNGPLAERAGVSETVTLPNDIMELVKTAVDKTTPKQLMKRAASGDAESLEAFGRSLSVEEGKLLEAVVIALARRSTDLVVLTGMRLPVTDAAVAIIEHNDRSKVRSLSIDPESKSKRGYFPDIVLANRNTAEAFVVDVKRSVASYALGNRLNELTTRMQAAGLALPDILWRDHDRLAVNHVSVAIIDGSKTEAESSDGIWSLSALDDLLNVTGAGRVASSAIAAYRDGISHSWNGVVSEIAGALNRQNLENKAGNNFRKPRSMNSKKTGTRLKRASAQSVKEQMTTVTVGLFRPLDGQTEHTRH